MTQPGTHAARAGVNRRGFIRAHLDSEQVTRVIYGAVVGLALVVALEPHPPGAATMAAIVVTTAVAVALAELYSDWIGHVLQHRTGFHREQVIEIAKDVSAVAIGIVFPDIFFLLATLGVLELDTAFTVAKWSGLGLISLYGYAAGRLSGESRKRSALQALAVTAIGIALIGFKAFVH
jgi:VIT1/CCC1 family predicted Fe2+/Mn2+ transporter